MFALLGVADGHLPVQILLLVRSPVVIVDLAAAILKMISTEPFAKAEDFLEGLLGLCCMLVVGLEASKQIIHVNAKHANQLRFTSKLMSLMWILIMGQEQASIKGVLDNGALANAQNSLRGLLVAS